MITAHRTATYTIEIHTKRSTQQPSSYDTASILKPMKCYMDVKVKVSKK